MNEKETDFTEPLPPAQVAFELIGRAAEIGWNMLWVKGFPMPKIKRDVVTGNERPPVQKGF